MKCWLFCCGSSGHIRCCHYMYILPTLQCFYFNFLKVQCDFVDIIQEHFSSNGLVVKCLEFAFKQEHIMDFTRMRALESLFSMIHQGVRNVLQYNQQHPDFPMEVCLSCMVTCILINALSVTRCLH